MIARDFETWRADACRLLRARYGIETEGVGLDDLLEQGHKAKNSPETVVERIGKKFGLADLEAWTHRNDPPETV